MWLWEEQGGLLGPFSFLLLMLLLVTRSPFNAGLFAGSLYLLLRLFSFEPVPHRRALQVLKPRDRVSAIAHRGGSHDAPENTLAAIRQVSPPTPKARARTHTHVSRPSARRSWEFGLGFGLPRAPRSLGFSRQPCQDPQEDIPVALGERSRILELPSPYLVTSVLCARHGGCTREQDGGGSCFHRACAGVGETGLKHRHEEHINETLRERKAQ